MNSMRWNASTTDAWRGHGCNWAGKPWGLQDWLLLALFATCHDLHANAEPPTSGTTSAPMNVPASPGACRILDQVGFRASRIAEFFVALSLMIAGSTFDARPAARNFFNTAGLLPLAGHLTNWWPSSGPNAPRRIWIRKRRFTPNLMLFAADLDTASG